MSLRHFFVSLVFLIFATISPANEPSVVDRFDLRTTLEREGYEAIPLTRTKRGYLGLHATIEGQKIFMHLDSGAPTTHLARKHTKDLRLEWREYPKGDVRDDGVAGNSECVAALEIGAVKTRPLTLVGYQCETLDKSADAYGDPYEGGLLGGDVLLPHGAIIDYQTGTLFLRKRDAVDELLDLLRTGAIAVPATSDTLPAAPPFDLHKTLAGQNFESVPLSKIGTRLQAPVKLAGARLTLWLDTASPHSYLDRRNSRVPGLKWRDFPKSTNYWLAATGLCEVSRLDVGAIKTHPMVFYGFDHPAFVDCDGLLGCDVLDRHLAVIDYRSGALFLKQNGREAGRVPSSGYAHSSPRRPPVFDETRTSP